MGKARKTDFTEMDLPRNRAMVFFDVYRLHWRRIAALGFFSLLALLPYLVLLFFRDHYAVALNALVQAGEMTAEVARASFVRVHLYASIGAWVSFYWAAFLIGGIARVIRQLVWAEPLFWKEDFLRGAKENFKFGAILATFFGTLSLVSASTLALGNHPVLQSIPLALFLVFLAPPLIITYWEGTIYTGGFFKLLKNATLMYVKSVPMSLLLSLVLLSPIFLKYIQSNLMLKYGILLGIILLFLSGFLMMTGLWSNHLFDRFINEQEYPQLVRKGMAPKNEGER